MGKHSGSNRELTNKLEKKECFFNDAESIISTSFLYLFDLCLSFVYNLLSMYFPAERYNKN